MTGRTTPAASPRPLDIMRPIPEDRRLSPPTTDTPDSLQSAVAGKEESCDCWIVFKAALCRFGRNVQEAFTALWEKICAAWNAMIACCYPQKTESKPTPETVSETTTHLPQPPLPPASAVVPASPSLPVIPPPPSSGKGARPQIARPHRPHATPMPAVASGASAAAQQSPSINPLLPPPPSNPKRSQPPIALLVRSVASAAAAVPSTNPPLAPPIPQRPGRMSRPLPAPPPQLRNHSKGGEPVVAPLPPVGESDRDDTVAPINNGDGDDTVAPMKGGDDTVASVAGGDGDFQARLAAHLDKPKPAAAPQKRIPSPGQFLKNIKAESFAVIQGIIDGYARVTNDVSQEFRGFQRDVLEKNQAIYAEFHPLEILAYNIVHNAANLRQIFSVNLVRNSFLAAWSKALTTQKRVAEYLPAFYGHLRIGRADQLVLNSFASQKKWREFFQHCLKIRGS